jgi:hypothetical protein
LPLGKTAIGCRWVIYKVISGQRPREKHKRESCPSAHVHDGELQDSHLPVGPTSGLYMIRTASSCQRMALISLYQATFSFHLLQAPYSLVTIFKILIALVPLFMGLFQCGLGSQQLPTENTRCFTFASQSTARRRKADDHAFTRVRPATAQLPVAA